MFDYLIVGQGLAGTVLSITLFLNNKSVFIIDNGEEFTASKVAGGIYNPVTGKRHNRTWMAEATFGMVESFYSKAEDLLQTKFLFPRSIYRPFNSKEEQIIGMKDLQAGKYAPYVQSAASQEVYSSYLHNEFGGLETTVSGYVDVPLLLSAARQFFIEQELFREAIVDYNQIYMKEDYVEWKGIKARKIIFCEGFLATKNPFFSWLPFKPVKGEIITIAPEQDIPMNLVSQGAYLIPLESRRCKVGATYNWDELDSLPTAQGKMELTEKLIVFFKPAFQVIKHEAGVRPATRDRRPFVGLHPDYKRIGIFNGLGTKGVSLAPFFASEFVAYLEKGKELNHEVNIQRFFSIYYKPV